MSAIIGEGPVIHQRIHNEAERLSSRLRMLSDTIESQQMSTLGELEKFIEWFDAIASDSLEAITQIVADRSSASEATATATETGAETDG